MKIVAGLGSIDEYLTFVKAGADEFFCGIVPYSWSRKYGNLNPLNRREVFYYNVQLGSFSELEILQKMVEEKKVPVKFTFNALYYTPEQYAEIADMICQCMKIGFDTFIIADPALILYLRQQKIPCKIHISGEMAEVNLPMIEFWKTYEIDRIIFHRKNSIDNMRACIQGMREQQESMEFEAFILNEMCHFTGAFCNSLHCDELCHLCREPYWIGDLKGNGAEQNENFERTAAEIEGTKEDLEGSEEDFEEEEAYRTGKTGCGLCSLYDLDRAGVTHLKVVGRGNYTAYMERDIHQLKRALDLLEDVKGKEQGRETYIEKMKQSLFQEGCSGNCYYRS